VEVKEPFGEDVNLVAALLKRDWDAGTGDVVAAMVGRSVFPATPSIREANAQRTYPVNVVSDSHTDRYRERYKTSRTPKPASVRLPSHDPRLACP
jgi:hypothetical protein